VIFIPFTKIQIATRISMRYYNYTPYKLEGPFGYCSYFAERWDEGETFINVEHDTVPWPGAIEALLECSEDWCGYGTRPYELWHFDSPNLAPLNSVDLACVKFSDRSILKTQNCWDDPVDWTLCDVHLFKTARAAGMTPHQHFPGVTNANPDFLSYDSSDS
jgi:hypothetical protein